MKTATSPSSRQTKTEFYHATNSRAGSAPGRLRPVEGWRIQPSGSPSPSHPSAAATAASIVSNHHWSSTDNDPAWPIVRMTL